MVSPSIVQTVANTILAVMWALFIDRTLEQRFSRGVSFAVWVFTVCAWLALAGFILPFGSSLRTMAGPVLFLLAALALYKSRWTRAVFSVGMTQVVMVLCEFIMLLLFPELRELTTGSDGFNGFAALAQLSMYLIYLPLNAMLLLLASFLFGRYKAALSGRDWLLYALFPASQMILCFSWFMLLAHGVTTEAVIWQSVAVLVCFAADVGLYLSMRGMAQRAALSAEKEMLEKQIDAQKIHYVALTEQYENIRRMRHDIGNHMHTMQILLEKGEHTQAAEYASELLSDTTYSSSLGQCENPVVDAFLYARLGELRADGIAVDTEVNLPAYPEVSNADLIIAFGNLLDNAEEACRGAADKHLAVRARVAKGYLAIETENSLPVCGAQEKKRRVPELPRGVGFHILQELAEKYDGTFTYRTDDGVFRAELALKAGETDAAYCNM